MMEWMGHTYNVDKLVEAAECTDEFALAAHDDPDAAADAPVNKLQRQDLRSGSCRRCRPCPCSHCRCHFGSRRTLFLYGVAAAGLETDRPLFFSTLDDCRVAPETSTYITDSGFLATWK